MKGFVIGWVGDCGTGSGGLNDTGAEGRGAGSGTGATGTNFGSTGTDGAETSLERGGTDARAGAVARLAAGAGAWYSKGSRI